jgi:NADP-dependent 3-hydroxy acid dehydrogenase YdfG
VLQGRRALVTGASGGIGAAVSRVLAAAGVRTLLVARRPEPLRALADTLRGAVPYAADLSDAAAVRALVAEAPALLDGPVDLLVNNAGVFTLQRIEATDDATIDAMLALNLAAPFRLVRGLLPAMRDAGRGHIVTIGSIADRYLFPENGIYASSKYGARAMHEILRMESRGTGVRATLIAPAATDTTIWDSLDPERRAGLPPREAMLDPAAVADAVLWAVTRGDDVNIDEMRLSFA